jgi:hypothetical protein
MMLGEFIKALKDAGWRGVNDAQHKNISAIWEQMTTCAEAERAEAEARLWKNRVDEAVAVVGNLEAENEQLRAVVDKLADINVERNREIERLHEMLKRLAPVVFAHEEQKRTAMATNV